MADKIAMSAIRAQFPMYADISDDQLLIAVRKRYYPDIPMGQFAQRIDYDTERERNDPTRDMGAGQRMLAGIGAGMTDLANGIGQRLGVVSQAEIDDKRRTDRPLMNTTAGAAGNVAGQIALALPTAWVPGANTVAGAAAVGGLMGAAQPTATGESVLRNTAIGAVGGAGGVVAGRAIKAGYQGGKALVEPFTQGGRQKIAGRVLERFAEDPAKLASASSRPTATGAVPTLAEATKDRGIAALERSISQQDPQIAGRFAQRAAESNAARVGVVQELAGDAAQRQAAEAARQAAAGQMYKAATSATYAVDDELAGLLQRPAVQQAMQRAKTLAANQGREVAFDVTPANAFSGVGVPTQTSRQMNGQALQDLKMAMDEMLSDPASGFAGKAGATVKQLRGQLVDWMERANPDFKAARTAYADLSKPLNQMDVGERLLEKTTAAMRDLGGNQRLQASAFARALNNEQGLVRQATGFKGVNALDDVLTPAQVGKLNAVRGELETAANLAQAANGPGSQTAKSLASQNLMRQLIGPTGMPQSWAESALLQTVMRPVQFGMQAAEPRIQQQLADILLDPALARGALKAAQPGGLLNPIARGLLDISQAAATRSVPAGLLSMSR